MKNCYKISHFLKVCDAINGQSGLLFTIEIEVRRYLQLERKNSTQKWHSARSWHTHVTHTHTNTHMKTRSRTTPTDTHLQHTLIYIGMYTKRNDTRIHSYIQPTHLYKLALTHTHTTYILTCTQTRTRTQLSTSVIRTYQVFNFFEFKILEQLPTFLMSNANHRIKNETIFSKNILFIKHAN